MLDKLNQEEFKRSGLLAVRCLEPTISADFIFVSFVAESLKNGRTVVYISSNRSSESFRFVYACVGIRNC
jgi:KaiC/GvpD/RAD55 family RecA-like ATPase